MTKVLFVATVVKTHIMEFHVPYLKMLKDMGWETAVAARNDYENQDDCVIPFCDTFFDVPFARNPFDVRNYTAYKKLKKVIDDGSYDIIHCHTPVGAMLTRLAARKVRKKGCKVFYTAHGFHFYKGAPLLNWILYYPVERVLARLTDVLITITREDYRRAAKFKASRIEYVPGVGIDLSKYVKKRDDVRNRIRQELAIPLTSKVLLSVGELNKNKNHKIVIEALPSLKDVYYIICGRGPLLEKYAELAKKLQVEQRVRLVGYRNDVPDFYNAADVFVFPSFREGLPVSLMEAMASELVCVASFNRGTDDLFDGNKELLFKASDLEELQLKLETALTRDWSQELQRVRKTLEAYDIVTTTKKVRQLYVEELRNINQRDVHG